MYDTKRDNPQIRVARLWRDPKAKMGILAVVAVTLLLVCLILYFTIYRGPSKTEFDVRRREERRRRKERRREERPRDKETKRPRDKETKRGEAKRDMHHPALYSVCVYVKWAYTVCIVSQTEFLYFPSGLLYPPSFSLSLFLYRYISLATRSLLPHTLGAMHIPTPRPSTHSTKAL